MLKGIPSILTPELLKVLMEMGHGDELVLADGNFPKFAHPANVIRLDGHGIPEILDAILKFMPLDPYVEHPTIFMDRRKVREGRPAGACHQQIRVLRARQKGLRRGDHQRGRALRERHPEEGRCLGVRRLLF